ncbi:SAM-dependent methyltransferase [Streptomyces europaeiscabiei]|uniref:SAM-dependent methyltransferase n=1 Tax=Streptomyces europaeiscabiei TaxID=146819 RepID=UPI0038F5E965
MPLGDIADVASPSVARMDNYLLGGKDHYPADREACARLLDIAPGALQAAEAGHRFLLRVTSHLAREYGMRQFLVFGAGLPTRVGVHQVAGRVDPRVRVVYVDDDPLALAHARAVWEDGRRTLVVRAEPVQAAHIIFDAAVRRLLDITQPVAALFVSALHTVGEPAGLLAHTASLLAPGSFIAASHLTSDDAEVRQAATRLMHEATAGRWGRVRTREEVEEFFDTMRLLAPGLTDVSRWRPGGDRAVTTGPGWAEYGGVVCVR